MSSETAETLAAARASGAASFSATLVGPSGETRTPGILLPKRNLIVFVAKNYVSRKKAFVYMHLCSYLIVVALSVLSLVMVKIVVKNADSPLPISGSGELFLKLGLV